MAKECLSSLKAFLFSKKRPSTSDPQIIVFKHFNITLRNVRKSYKIDGPVIYVTLPSGGHYLSRGLLLNRPYLFIYELGYCMRCSAHISGHRLPSCIKEQWVCLIC